MDDAERAAGLEAAAERVSRLARRLIADWMPALPEVRVMLAEGGSALVVGAAASWACPALAGAFPEARLSVCAPDDLTLPREGFDLVLAVDALEQSGDPIPCLVAVRNALRPAGTLVLLVRPESRYWDRLPPLAMRAGLLRIRPLATEPDAVVWALGR